MTMKSKLNVLTATALAVACSAWLGCMVYAQTTAAKPKLAPKPKLNAAEESIFRLGAIIGATLERRDPGKYTDGNKLADAAWKAWQSMEAPATNAP